MMTSPLPDAAWSDFAVLLATFNGERHLPQQLESLLAQRAVRWTLYWRDDGSTDRTVEMLESFAAATGRVRRVSKPSGRLGPGQSFMALLRAVEGDGLVAFCDQDDVWLPDKLARAAEALSLTSTDQAAIYCGRQTLVDADLTVLGLSPMPQKPPSFANALVQNVVTGCTLVLNAPARRLALSTPFPAGSMHDWWCYLIVSGSGGTVMFDPEPAMLYRQHQQNVVGASRALTRAWRAALRGPRPFLKLLAQHVEALQAAPLTPDARTRVDALRGIEARNPFRRLASLRKAGVFRQSFGEEVVLHLWIALYRTKRSTSPARYM
jgi:hypothetical protein